MQTDIRGNIKAKKKEEKSIGNLSIIVGPNRKGDIVVRVGDDLNLLVKNFIASYGLKKDVAPTILASLQQLVKNHSQKESPHTKTDSISTSQRNPEPVTYF